MNIISLGISGTIKYLVLTGLGVGSPPFTFAIANGQSVILSANVAYALPAKCSRIQWQCAAAGTLSASLDGVHFSVIDTSLAADNRTINVAATFIKSNVDIIITCRSEKI